jgi:cell division protein FtsQ
MSKNERRNSENVLIRLCKKILGVLLIIGIPAAAFISTFHMKVINVEGSERYTKEAITTQLVKSKPDSNSLYFYLKYKYFENPKIPFVEKLDVELTNNHTVTVYVYEKMVTGCVDFMGEYLYFDKDGIVVESSSKRLKDIPEIKGLQFDKIILNQKLEVQKDELFQVILNLTQQIDKFDLDVDTIRFNIDYEVTVDCGDIKVLLGKRSTYDEVLAELTNILKEAKGMDIVLDMREFQKGTNRIIAKQKKPTD